MHLFDTSTDHLDHAFARAEEGGSEDLMTLHHVASGDYGQLDVPYGVYDLVTTEGLGFELDALSYVDRWSKLVKPGGALAITVPGLTNQQVNPEVVAQLNERRGAPLATLDYYHEQIASLKGVKLIHQVTLAQHSWDEHYQNLGRSLLSLIKTGEVSPANEAVQNAQAELDWYRSLARGHIFLQAFVLAVES
jgi:SAM-dependent methyltransferase